MEEEIYRSNYAGHTITYSFVYPETRYHFRPLPLKKEEQGFDIKASAERIEKTRSLLPEGTRDGYVEYRSLIGLTANELLKYNCCIFHAVSFVWKEKAYLLTGPSGVGKTTQYNNWQKAFPGEIRMICGDMPLIELREDGRIWVHPTSWNGKENIGNRIKAPLGEMIFLEQGRENSILLPSEEEAIILLFNQFVVRPATEQAIVTLGRLIEQMIKTVPYIKFVNNGGTESTALLRSMLQPALEVK